MVGLWLSLNVLSFQTSLETWTTAAIIFGGWSLRSHCKFGNESVVDYESWARESTDVPKDNICVFVFYFSFSSLRSYYLWLSGGWREKE